MLPDSSNTICLKYVLGTPSNTIWRYVLWRGAVCPIPPLFPIWCNKTTFSPLSEIFPDQSGTLSEKGMGVPPNTTLAEKIRQIVFKGLLKYDLEILHKVHVESDRRDLCEMLRVYYKCESKVLRTNFKCSDIWCSEKSLRCWLLRSLTFEVLPQSLRRDRFVIFLFAIDTATDSQ